MPHSFFLFLRQSYKAQVRLKVIVLLAEAPRSWVMGVSCHTQLVMEIDAVCYQFLKTVIQFTEAVIREIME